jgi:solute carrier family 39 (zinc transporter), member 9
MAVAYVKHSSLYITSLNLTKCNRSFLAGALPLSMTLSQSQLRLISSIGVGILVGTSLIVIIPEGIEAVASTSAALNAHATPRSVLANRAVDVRWEHHPATAHAQQWKRRTQSTAEGLAHELGLFVRASTTTPASRASEEKSSDVKDGSSKGLPANLEDVSEAPTLSTFFIGFALMLGFVLMFLVDRLPRHATENFVKRPTTRHISLDDLSSGAASGDEETDGFLGSMAPTPKQSRSLATTTGLVIHAAADGIAMGASATTANMELGLIIFVAILVHKAPAAFGLTSVLLKQGLSKRAARGHLVIFSLAAPLGALTTYMVISLLGGSTMQGENGQWWTGMLLLFSAGTFL